MRALEDICVCHETAKALVEAEIVVETVFSYFYFQNAKYPSEPILKFTYDNLARWSFYPAPTFEELYPLFPKDLALELGGIKGKLCERLAGILIELKKEGRKPEN